MRAKLGVDLEREIEKFLVLSSDELQVTVETEKLRVVCVLQLLLFFGELLLFD